MPRGALGPAASRPWGRAGSCPARAPLPFTGTAESADSSLGSAGGPAAAPCSY